MGQLTTSCSYVTCFKDTRARVDFRVSGFGSSMVVECKLRIDNECMHWRPPRVIGSHDYISDALVIYHFVDLVLVNSRYTADLRALVRVYDASHEFD